MRPFFRILYEMLGRSQFETLLNSIMLTPKPAPYPLPNPPSHQHPSTFILPNLSITAWVARTTTCHFSNLNLLSCALSCLSLLSRPYESILSIFIFLFFFLSQALSLFLLTLHGSNKSSHSNQLISFPIIVIPLPKLCTSIHHFLEFSCNY